ncbi:hypothetical protein ACNHKD_17545 [Methylocystis sp. JAN1]|uniref:bestrophin-like domain n=1 Tax=Methylocystis sp. JAN1 TaxID=3397211 RepID=UPI003FA1EA56
MLVHIGVLHLWMEQSTEVMALTAGAAFAAFALLVCWLSFASPVAPMMQKWKGVVPPFVGVPATLFGLLMTFLSQDVWDANRRAYREVAVEREQLTTLLALSESHGSDAGDLPRAVRAYVEAVVGLEWKTMENGEDAPEAEAALDRLIRAASNARIEPAFQRVLIDTVMKLRSAREERLAIAGAYPDDRKWAAVILIAFITQASLAAVHLDRARPQLLAQAIFAAAAIVAIALVASVEEPYSPPNAVSSEPLERLLDGLPAS